MGDIVIVARRLERSELARLAEQIPLLLERGWPFYSPRLRSGLSSSHGAGAASHMWV